MIDNENKLTDVEVNGINEITPNDNSSINSITGNAISEEIEEKESY